MINLFSFRLEADPETITDLSNSLNLLERIQTSDVPNIESQFKPLNDQFNMLHQHEVMVSEAVEIQHKSLQSSWASFQQCLVNADSKLKKHKVRYFNTQCPTCTCTCSALLVQGLLLCSCHLYIAVMSCIGGPKVSCPVMISAPLLFRALFRANLCHRAVCMTS